MRLIDVCIPHFGAEESSSFSTEPVQTASNTFQLPTTLFGQTDSEYNVEDDDIPSMSQEEQFFEADDGSSTVSAFDGALPIMARFLILL